jgi:hypothetical protein
MIRTRAVVVAAVGLWLLGCTGTPATPTTADAPPSSVAAEVTGPCANRMRLGDGRVADLRVFLAPDADEVQVEGVRALLASSPAVAGYEYLDKDATRAESEALYADRDDMTRAVDRSAIPTSFLVVVATADQVRALDATLGAAPGVRAVLSGFDRPAGCPED